MSSRGVELGDVAAEFHQRTRAIRCRCGSCCTAHNAKARSPRSAPAGATVGTCASSRRSRSRNGRRVLGRYLGQLRPTDRAVLSSLSCIGGEFDLDDAAAAAAQPPDVVAQALWACLELRLLEALDSGGRRIANAISRDARYRFSHDRVAEAAREGMSDNATRDAHLRIGRAWSNRGRPAVRGRAPRRYPDVVTDGRRRARSVRRGAAACGTEGEGAGLVPVGAQHCRNGWACSVNSVGKDTLPNQGAAARRRRSRAAGR